MTLVGSMDVQRRSRVTTATGFVVILYLDMYHAKNDPGKQLAPVGFYKKRD